MDLVELTDYMVKLLVSNKEAVSVKQYDEEEYLTIEVLVDAEDMGVLIGKQGKTINAIRTIIQASSYANNLKRVRINVDSF